MFLSPYLSLFLPPSLTPFLCHIYKAMLPWMLWLSGLSTGLRTKGHWFNSQSGHVPGLRARSPVGDTQEATTH